MENAWRHRRGQVVGIRVEATVEEGLLALQVADDGRGLDPTALRRGGELGFSTRPNGVGLGLFLLRRAVSARGGAVLLERVPRGAQATVLLPLNAPHR
jgi:signal transduction histidine kinase